MKHRNDDTRRSFFPCVLPSLSISISTSDACVFPLWNQVEDTSCNNTIFRLMKRKLKKKKWRKNYVWEEQTKLEDVCDWPVEQGGWRGENQCTPGFSVKTEGGLRACHSDKGSWNRSLEGLSFLDFEGWDCSTSPFILKRADLFDSLITLALSFVQLAGKLHWEERKFNRTAVCQRQELYYCYYLKTVETTLRLCAAEGVCRCQNHFSSSCSFTFYFGLTVMRSYCSSF